ncbi:hypothetical protein Tco_0717977 [Tanacetum coccineum]
MVTRVAKNIELMATIAKTNGPWSELLLLRTCAAKTQTEEELTEAETKQVKAYEQVIHLILMGLPVDVYAVVCKCENAHDMWLHVRRMMQGTRKTDSGNNHNGVLVNKQRELGIQRNAEKHDFLARQHSELPKSSQSSYVEPQYDSNIITATLDMHFVGGEVEQHVARIERLTTELAKYKGQQKFFVNNEQKYNEFETGYRNFVYAKDRLTKQLDDLTRKSEQTDKTLDAKIYNLKNHISKREKDYSLLEKERDELKIKFSNQEDKLIEQIVEFDDKINEMTNIIVKTGQSLQTIHMLSLKPDYFYHTEGKMALGYKNTLYLKQAQKKQSALYDGKVLC